MIRISDERDVLTMAIKSEARTECLYWARAVAYRRGSCGRPEGFQIRGGDTDGICVNIFSTCVNFSHTCSYPRARRCI